MTDEEKAHYEEWQKKCAATRARKKQELAQERAKLIKEKPAYRIPGSKKGQLVWIGYRQQQTDINMVRNAEKHKEAAARRAIEAANAPPISTVTPAPMEPTKRNEIKPYEVILAYLFVCVYGLKRSMAKKYEGKTFDEHSERTVDHELAITQFHISLKKELPKKYLLTWYQSNIKRGIAPDAYFSITDLEDPSKATYHYFLEI